MLLAIVLLQLGNVSVDRQEAMCLEYILDCGYQLAGWIQPTGSSEDAVKMVAAGEAHVVVVAYGGAEYAADIIAAGGRIEAVHPTPHVVEPHPAVRDEPQVDSLAQLLRASGRTVREIAEFIGSSTAEVRRIIRGR